VTALLFFYQGVLRGFSGHMNHAELLLLYATGIVAVFPCFDALSVRKAKSVTQKQVMYAAPFVVIGILLCVTYSFVGIVRLAKGPELFFGDTMRNLILHHWIELGDISGPAFAAPLGRIAILDVLPPSVVQAGYVLGTMFELLAPFALVSRRFRFLFVGFAATFHVLNAVGLGVLFTENCLLLIVFSQAWFHRVANVVHQTTTELGLKFLRRAPDSNMIAGPSAP
jgi:hypothetical protein